MRFPIEQAVLPFHIRHWSVLCAAHERFTQALARLRKPPSPEQTAAQVKKLSLIYNSLSPASPYNRPELVDARLHFFMPSDIVKVWGPMGEVVELAVFSKREISVLDLGCGAGTASVGLAMVLAAAGFAGTVSFTLVEPDPALLRHLRVSFQALRDAGIVRHRTRMEPVTLEEHLAARRTARHDLVVALNVLCEAFSGPEYLSATRALVKTLLRDRLGREGVLLVIEPALKRFARLVAELGDRCRDEGTALYAPCLAGPPCPQRDSAGRAFCFHSCPVPVSPFLQSVSARSGLDRHEVNYAYLSLTPGRLRLFEEMEKEDGEACFAGRIISFPKRVKKGYHYFVCTGRGVVQGFAPRMLPDGRTRGGRLRHGTLVRLGA